MWAYRMSGAESVERVEVDDEVASLAAGQVRLRTRVVGICGSDMPRFKGVRTVRGGRVAGEAAPVHEIVGDVVETRCEDLPLGRRVVGTLGVDGDLAEFVTVDGSTLIAAPASLDDVEAVTIQPLATILRAAAKFPEVAGRRVAVLGAGPIGLAFCHVLSRRGAAQVVAVDPIERSEVALGFGAHRFYATTAAGWVSGLAPAERPELVVEAVGHQQQTLADAIAAAAEHGYVCGFGAPDDEDYVVPYNTIYEKDLTVASGKTIEWRPALERAAAYLLEHRTDFASYVSHRVGAAHAAEAYELYARPRPGRLKVVIVAT